MIAKSKKLFTFYSMKDKPTITISDVIYEIILMSPIWGIGLVAGWNEISKFIDTL